MKISPSDFQQCSGTDIGEIERDPFLTMLLTINKTQEEYKWYRANTADAYICNGAKI